MELQLFKLYHNEQEIDGLTEEIAKKTKHLDKENSKKERIEEEIRDRKKEHAKLMKELTRIDQQIKESVCYKMCSV